MDNGCEEKAKTEGAGDAGPGLPRGGPPPGVVCSPYGEYTTTPRYRVTVAVTGTAPNRPDRDTTPGMGRGGFEKMKEKEKTWVHSILGYLCGWLLHGG